MIVRHEKKSVEVRDAACRKRSCFSLGQDKGTFVQGRGYVSYHARPRWVCGTRHLHGCPIAWVCPVCRTCQVEGVTTCEMCGAARGSEDDRAVGISHEMPRSTPGGRGGRKF